MIKVTHQYREALNRRNEAQLKAIEALDGPVLVIAGPGTGKTDVLSLRIGNILLKTDATSGNILCLTYTEAGASEMRARLLEYIGPEASNVRIQTFHGFCNSIIQEHIGIFGGTKDMKPVSDLEKMEILIEIIDALPEDNVLRRFRGEIYYDRWALKNLHELMKGEGWSVDFLNKTIDAWLEEARTHQDFVYKTSRYGAKGSLRQKVYDREAEKMEILRAAGETFAAYTLKLEEKQRYDFADMLIWVRDAFQSNPDLLLDYQEKFQYLLVDEFQDTNGIQLELLRQLTDYEHPNIFAVGDDDQAIFRFQGALVRNIAEFCRAYDPEIITLDKNYRSSELIIRSASEVIQYNRAAHELEGLNFNKSLEAAGVNKDFPAMPGVLTFQNRDQELAFLAEELTRLYKAGILEKESVAVIYRRHVLAENLVRVLRHHEVPFTLARDVNLLDEPLVVHVMMILGYITEQYLGLYAGDDILFAIMHFRHFEIPPRDIARIAHACKAVRKDGTIVEMRKALRDLVSNKRRLKSLKLEATDKVLAFSDAIEELCGNVHDDTPHAFLERLMHTTGLLRWILLHPERDWFLLLMKSLMEHCAREMDASPGLTINDYIALLARHREHLVSIPVRKAIEAYHGIELLTAHGAKGHEYDRVYMLGSTKQDWEDFRSRGDAYALPGNLVADRKLSSVEDDRRLFYVAMTRARRHLTLTYAQSDTQTANLEPSRFVSELVAAEHTPKERLVSPDSIDVYGFFTAILDRKTVFPEMIDKALVDEVMQDYSLSATDFNLYLECPRAFYFEKILRIPSAPQLYFAFGNVIHKCLELLFREYWDTLFLTEDTLLDLFEREMEHSRGKFTEKEYQDHLIHGRETLKLYSAEFASAWRDPDAVTTEYKVDRILYRDVPLKGFLDKVEIRPTTVHIIDYKTGKYEGKKFYPPNERYPLGGAHWRQMLFYKILLEEDPSQEWNVVKGIMDFVDIKRNKKAYRKEILFSDDEIAVVSDMIVDVYNRIRAYDFDHRCTRWRCKWCELIDSEFPKKESAATDQTDESVHLEE